MIGNNSLRRARDVSRMRKALEGTSLIYKLSILRQSLTEQIETDGLGGEQIRSKARLDLVTMIERELEDSHSD
jgi:hypothetical protein